MHIFFVDLGVVVYVDTERGIWDYDTKIQEKSWSWSWNKKSCLGLGLKNYGGLGLEIQSLGLGLDKKALVLVLTTNSYLHHCILHHYNKQCSVNKQIILQLKLVLNKKYVTVNFSTIND